jgi:dihydrofolate reductase
MKAAARRDVTIGGPNLAAHAFRAGRIDECHLFLTPVTVGGGNPAFPANLRVNPALLDERRFGSGVIYLHYRVL